MFLRASDIQALERRYKLKLINGLSGYKSVHLIGTKGKNGISNLGLFSSVVHISSEPARIGFIARPKTDAHQTLQNIEDTEFYTLNHVQQQFLKKAHYTSANFPAEISEFERCGLEEVYLPDFHAPFVGESALKMGVQLEEICPIPSNNSFLVIGKIHVLDVPDTSVLEDGQLNLEDLESVCVTGLNRYAMTEHHTEFPYARVDEVPAFTRSKKPDQIVFDEEKQQYNASLLPYGTNIGSPSIVTGSVSNWKNNSIQRFNHNFNSKIEDIKKQYTTLVQEFERNELVYSAKMNFEPVVGMTYHLYRNKKGEHFLSLVDPNSWKQEYLGTFRLNHDHTWEKQEASGEHE